MNNQKGEEGDPTREELWLGKKKRRSEKAKQPLLCWLFEVLPPADTGAQTHTKAHRLALPLFLSVLAAFSLSLSLLPLSSPPHPFIFTLGLLQGSPLSPSTYHSFAVQALISARGKDQQHTLDPFLQLPWL